MKKIVALVSSSLLMGAALAAPKDQISYEPTAEGYPTWAGLTEANRVCGRHLCPSDLRHKLAAVVFVDAEAYEAQLKTVATIVTRYNPLAVAHAVTPESYVLSRDTICLVVLVGKTDATKVNDFLKKNAKELRGNWIVYSNVTSPQVPDQGGKYPFYCVFGPEPGDPLAFGSYDAAAGKTLAKIRIDKKYRLENWRPYYGSIEEPQFIKGYAKALSSGRPLETLTTACRKGIVAKDPEKAKECQILYDALEQTRSDYLCCVMMFAKAGPTRALYDAQIVTKQWPKTKKLLKDEFSQISSVSDVSGLVKMYAQLKKWSEPDFTCKSAAEAKKIEAELKKMKTACDGLVQKSSVAAVQSSAAWIANEAENLAPLMASKVQVK